MCCICKMKEVTAWFKKTGKKGHVVSGPTVYMDMDVIIPKVDLEKLLHEYKDDLDPKKVEAYVMKEYLNEYNTKEELEKLLQGCRESKSWNDCGPTKSEVKAWRKKMDKNVRESRRIDNLRKGNLRIDNLRKGNRGQFNTGRDNVGDKNGGDCNTGSCNIGRRNAGWHNSGNYNTGNHNTGDQNSGYLNSGNLNTGNRNEGNKNTGSLNAGHLNTGWGNQGNENTGGHNTGDGNTGNKNEGDSNTGCANKGYRNTGNENGGSHNTGDENSGDQNAGNKNSGDCNAGDENSGDCNAGDKNSGDLNIGDKNSGDLNTGSNNAGDRNIGHHNEGRSNLGNGNLGSGNIGDYNLSSVTLGNFCTTNGDYRMFNKKCTKGEFYARLPGWFDFGETNWIKVENMTDGEKVDNPSHNVKGGYLKKTPYKEAAKKAWDCASDEEKQATRELPNFDDAVFQEIFGFSAMPEDFICRPYPNPDTLRVGGVPQTEHRPFYHDDMCDDGWRACRIKELHTEIEKVKQQATVDVQHLSTEIAKLTYLTRL